ncbi:MAG TPA: NADH-quinone oxidoreductase subunit NuoE [Bacillota bacterium]|nr:NADH-quinone oxidoreductase subunit NuoE [Bacillota bacterium]HPL53858.1 NADH-quinone oxidoreductase subunit NuoE [Bacillota bacterium]
MSDEAMKEKMEKLEEIITEHKDQKGSLIPVLHETQELFGYIPEEAQRIISEKLNIPMAEIFGVATFYSRFTLNPRGENTIRVCLGTACYVKNAQGVLDKLEEELKVTSGSTTQDKKFTLEATRCLGCCGLAPVMMINEDVYGKLVPEDIPKILKDY